MARPGIVRPFQMTDIPQVAELHRNVFRISVQPRFQIERQYLDYLNEFILDNTWGHTGLHSLVYETAGGTIVGFLGVRPQPMRIREKPMLAAVSSQFIVDRNHRSSLAGIHLLKAFLAGPQELSIVDEASESSRKLWHQFGGSTALLQSIFWARILRPCRFLLSRLQIRRGKSLVHSALSPILHIADEIAAVIPGNPFALTRPDDNFEHSSKEELLDCMRAVTCKWELHPAYESHSLNRILTVLESRSEHGPLRNGIVRNSSGCVTGWFIYHAKRHGLGEVLQIGAVPNSYELVLDQLFFDARQQGVVALSGRMQPEFMDNLREKHCLFHHRGYWTLIHSRNSDALHAIHSGNAFLTRLEGEWPMRFDISGSHPMFNEDMDAQAARSIQQDMTHAAR